MTSITTNETGYIWLVSVDNKFSINRHILYTGIGEGSNSTYVSQGMSVRSKFEFFT